MMKFAMRNTIENGRVKCTITTRQNGRYISLNIVCAACDVNINVYGDAENVITAIKTLAATKIKRIADTIRTTSRYIFACIIECVEVAAYEMGCNNA